MTNTTVFESRTLLPDAAISERAKSLLGFDERFKRVRNQLQLLLNAHELEVWSQKHYGKKLSIIDLAKDQYPLIIFHGDVGTGKTAMAEAISNRLVAEAKVEDSELFKLSNRVRGSGKVGEMGSLIAGAFSEIAKACGKSRRAVLIIDEGDSLGASRSQENSHHEDKVAVNTLIQAIDEIRKHGGRVVVFLCSNRIRALDPAILRRASIIEEFSRPNDMERKKLFEMDLSDLDLNEKEIKFLVEATGHRHDSPGWTYSDIRTRLYPAALSLAFPHERLGFQHLQEVIATLRPSPAVDNS